MTEISPEQLSIRRRELAMDYNKNMKELAEIKKRKAFKIIELLDKHKTVAKAELYYSTTEDGQREIELMMTSKGLLELMRAVKTEVDMKSAEARGQY